MLSTLEKAKALREFNALRLALLGSELKTLEKVKSLKRFNELRILLGGEKPKSIPKNIKNAALIIQAGINGLGARSIHKLAGDKKTDIRRSILEIITGENPPKSKAGVSVIASELNKIAGADITGDIFGDWIDSAAKGVYLDVAAYYKQKREKENALEQLQKQADDFGKKYDFYSDDDYFPYTTKGAKKGEWRFIVLEDGKINVRYFDGDNVKGLYGFDTLQSAYDALKGDEDYQQLMTAKEDKNIFLRQIANDEINVFVDQPKLATLESIDENSVDMEVYSQAVVNAAKQVLTGLGYQVVV